MLLKSRGVSVKTRKRNIVVPSDPGSFAEAVIQLLQDSSDGVNPEADLENGAKALDAADLEYARYGDTLFEVFFVGGRLATGASLAEGGSRLQYNVCGGEVDSWGQLELVCHPPLPLSLHVVLIICRLWLWSQPGRPLPLLSRCFRA